MKTTASIFQRAQWDEHGATAAETAITIMVFLTIVLGIIQLTLAIHAKLLVNYAAYCAARAGIVHNGDEERMKQAAAVALTPLFSGSDDLISLAEGYTVAANSPGLQVEILSPDPAVRFGTGYQKRFFPEVRKYDKATSASDVQHLDENLLKVKVTYRYFLRIPYIKDILSPVLNYVDISSTHQMRMQSDRFTQPNP